MTTIDLPDGEYSVVDAIGGGLPTVFFEQDGDKVGNAVIEPTELPVDRRHTDAILRIEVRDSTIVSTQYDPDRTVARSGSAQDRFDRLPERPQPDADS